MRGLIGEGDRDTGVRERIRTAREAWQAQWQPYLTNDDGPLSPYRVIHEMNQNLDGENSIVTHDAGAPRDQIVPFYTATTPHSYIGWGKTTHLGFSIPLMIGAKMGMPERMCVNLMGDGAFGMSGLDIETSARAGIPITTIVLNNGIMATYPGGFPTAREQFGVSHMQGDYAGLAQGDGSRRHPCGEDGTDGPSAQAGAAAERGRQNGADRREDAGGGLAGTGSVRLAALVEYDEDGLPPPNHMRPRLYSMRGLTA